MEKQNLYQKIQAVANEIKNLSKDMSVGKGNYAYKAVSDLSVTLKVKEAESQFGVLSIPIKQDLIHHEVLRTVKGTDESLKFHFIIKMTVRFIDVENPESFIDVETFGHGLDSGDKGFGKGSTYARKYALLNAYKIATGDDPDADPSENLKGKNEPSEKRTLVLNYMLQSEKTTQDTLKYFNVASVEDLTEKEIDIMYATYKQKKLI